MIRLLLFGFLALAVIYVIVSIYSRSMRREKLEKKWAKEVNEGDRDAYVEEGLKRYEQSFRRRLLILIFILPALVVFGTIYVINYM